MPRVSRITTAFQLASAASAMISRLSANVLVDSRGKCCANSRIDSKIELPTSASGYRCGNGECECVVYTHNEVGVCGRLYTRNGSMNEPGESFFARFATFDVTVFYQVPVY